MPRGMKYQIKIKHRLIGYTRKKPSKPLWYFPFSDFNFSNFAVFGRASCVWIVEYRANSSASRINNFGHDNTYLQKTGRGENHIIEVTPLRLAKRDIQLVTLQIYW